MDIVLLSLLLGNFLVSLAGTRVTGEAHHFDDDAFCIPEFEPISPGETDPH